MTSTQPQCFCPAPLLRTKELLAQARELHASERVDQAVELYKVILAVEPANAEARFFQALALFQLGHTEPALATMAETAEAHVNEFVFQLNLGVVLDSSGLPEQALPLLRRAVVLDPKSAIAHLNLGGILMRVGDSVQAAKHLALALTHDPSLVEAADALGLVLESLGHLDRALTCFRKSLSVNPNSTFAHNNCGNLLTKLGRYNEAVSHYDQAISIDPTFIHAHSNRSGAQRLLGQLAEAELSARNALSVDKTFIPAKLNLANTLKDQGCLEVAANLYLEILESSPHHPAAANNLAETRKEQGRTSEAVAIFRSALNFESPAMAYSNLLYLHSFTRDIPPEVERAIAAEWEAAALSAEERAAARNRATPGSGTFATAPRDGRRLRLGIISAELGTHAVAEFLEPVLACLDRSRIHITLFPIVGRSDPRAQALFSQADSYISLVGISDAAAADRVRQHAIDVLIDTTGHTANCRLGIVAHRAAPIQVSWIGYWSTSGLTEMDYFLSDMNALPSMDLHFTERLWRLPRIAVCYAGDATLPCDEWQRDPEGTLWLGSLNKYSKIREQTLVLWSAVLHALPHSRLFLEDRCTNDSETHVRIRTVLASHGIAEDRVHFEPYVPGHERHMALYNRFDIALDTIPFNSGTTAFDALWMGLPLVVLEGTCIGSRMGSSILKAFGRPEWIAQTCEEYVGIVQTIAASLPQSASTRHQLRKTQRDHMARSPLCDAISMARSLEDALECMHDQWLASR